MSYKVVMPNGTTKVFTGDTVEDIMDKIDRDLDQNFPNF